MLGQVPGSTLGGSSSTWSIRVTSEVLLGGEAGCLSRQAGWGRGTQDAGAGRGHCLQISDSKGRKRPD